ncbi:MAG: sulfatase [Pirellulaceae bacterium]|jgi:arylsulfatase A-like enzyme|nr:sulfatase [Pirellulaceae bacterium]MDP7016272.1 sulfatase [Pirellulaceae bacterium]
MILLLSAGALVVGESRGAERPNFIVIIADDVGWNDLGCYGHPHVQTPRFDRMAKEGLLFRQAFLTCSSCSPSRCSIVTGRYPHSTGASELHMPLPGGQTVFAGLLKQAGYYTASAGKWHLGEAPRKNFDRIEGGRPSGCEKWIDVLRERPRDKPFFFWFASTDAHRGYKKNIIPRPHERADVVVPPFIPDAPEARDDLALYYDEVSRLDSYSGKVLDELRAQGVDKETMVIFLSDNGRPFPRCKTTVYDSGVRTPFIVWWPGRIGAGQVTDSLVSSVDIAPTICELAGVPRPASFQGVSFAKVLQQPQHEVREYAFAEHNWHDYQAFERGVRSARYLYIRNGLPHLPGTPPADAVRSPTYAVMQARRQAGELKANQRGCFVTPRPSEELYDIDADPHSLNNLVNSQAHAKQLAKMRRVLQAWTARTGDSMPKSPTPDWFHREKGTRLPDVQGKRGDPAGGE